MLSFLYIATTVYTCLLPLLYLQICPTLSSSNFIVNLWRFNAVQRELRETSAPFVSFLLRGLNRQTTASITNRNNARLYSKLDGMISHYLVYRRKPLPVAAKYRFWLNAPRRTRQCHAPSGWWSGYFRCHRLFHQTHADLCYAIIISHNLRFVKTFCKFEEASVRTIIKPIMV